MFARSLSAAVLAGCGVLVAPAVQAQTRPVAPSDTLRAFDMPQIEVVGPKGRIARIPGAVTVVSAEDIQKAAALTGGEVLRRVPGVHVVEEEGMGLRANIGLRGLDPDRSRTLLVLEDGVPVALAPYGEPELYYTPPMERMAGVEVVRGSGSILFGPQTIGGVLNYVTADPSERPAVSATLRGGAGGYALGHVRYSARVGEAGVTASLLRRQADHIGALGFDQTDVTLKSRLPLGARTVLGTKVQLYDETSNATYIGLTQGLYERGSFDTAVLAPHDRLALRRLAVSATLDHTAGPAVRVRTTAYAYTTERNWARQDVDLAPVAGRAYDRLVGDSLAAGTLYFRGTTGNRNRAFDVVGIEPRVQATLRTGRVVHAVEAGARLLAERAVEQRVDGTVAAPTTGTLREDEIRTGRALAAFVQDQMALSPVLDVTPGVRLEVFDYERQVLRVNNQTRPATAGGRVTAWIPGLGLAYRPAPTTTLFAGVHRGFAPPRVKDAVTSAGVSEQLDAELSWNAEAGVRARLLPGLRIEATAFRLDFSNQVIPVSESSGGAGSVGAGVSLVNGGQTRHTGLEFGTTAAWLRGPVSALFTGTLTLVDARFASERFVMQSGQPVNVEGNVLPYAPALTATATAELGLRGGTELRLTASRVGKQYGDVLNTTAGSADGRSGPVAAYTLLDGSLRQRVGRRLAVSVAGKNLLDARYIVSRRPQGIRVGLPRYVTFGVEWAW